MLKWGLRALAALIVLAVVLPGAAYFALRRADIPYQTLAAEYANAESRYLDLPSGVRMHYRDEGAPGGPALVLIHGFSSSLHTWEPWVRALGDRYRIVSLDLPGHGLTSAPEDFDASIEAFRDVVREATLALHLDRFALAGNSMGGNVAWEYALAHPEQLSALILIDSSGWPQEADGGGGPPQMMLQLLRDETLGPLLRDLDNSALFRAGLRSSFIDQSYASDEAIERHADLSRAPGHRAILLDMTLSFSQRNHATPGRLAALGLPVLILHGESDQVVPFAHGELFESAIAGAKLVALDAGHLPHEELAAETAAITHEFLASSAAP